MDRSSDRPGPVAGRVAVCSERGVGGLLWLTLVVVLPLRSSIALACPSCGYSYGPRILLKMACPHCGEPVPTDVCTGRGMIAVLVLLAALVVGKEAYTWPMALPSLPQEEVSVTVQRNAYPLVENYAAFPQTQMEHYVLKPGTPEAEKMAEILSDYTYRRCWKTLRGDTAGLWAGGGAVLSQRDEF